MGLKIKHGLQPKRRLPILLAYLCLAGGFYLLITIFYPFFSSQLTDPQNNSTTKLVAKTGSEPAKYQLYIPKLDINLPYATGDESVMKNGAWWRMPENGNPKDGGNFVLSAHRFIMGLTPMQTQRLSPFYNINKLVVGDDIIIDYLNKRYTYEITKIYAVKPDAISIEERTKSPQLTLYSCTLGGASDGRDVIIATQKS